LVQTLEERLRSRSVPSSTLSLVLDRIDHLQKKAGNISQNAKKLAELQAVDVPSAWNFVRKILEEVMLSVHRDAGLAPGSMPLKQIVDQLNAEGVLPQDIKACVDLIREYGNIGSHPTQHVYNPSPEAMSVLVGALAQVLEWYVIDFQPSVETECPNPDCRARQPQQRSFCSVCGSKLPRQRAKGKCPRCHKGTDNSMRFCGNCGLSLSGPVDGAD